MAENGKTNQETAGVIDKLVKTAGAFLASDISFSRSDGIPQPFADCKYIKDSIKLCYDHSYNLHNVLDTETDCSLNSRLPTLTELYVNGPDAEQIWQQVDHKYNSAVGSNTAKPFDKGDFDLGIPLAKLKPLTQNGDRTYSESSESENDEEQSNGDSSEEDFKSEDEEIQGSDDEMNDEDDEYSSQVDDDFFSLKKMHAFLDKQDAAYMKDPDGFETMPELYDSDPESEGHQYRYNDLFAGSKAKTSRDKQSADDDGDEIDDAEPRRVRKPYGDSASEEEDLDALDDDEELSDEEVELMKALDEETADKDVSDEEEEVNDENDNKDSGDDSDAEHLQDVIGKRKNEPTKSEYERRTDKLRDRISAMEEEAMSDKPWQLKGEVTARSRPENSLIQEAVEFDSNVAPVPAVTMETTHNLEALIIQRIKDKAFDDVERKTRLKEDGEKYKKRIELDHEKSKQSLSQIYEQEYLKLRDKDDEDEEEKENPEEAAIKRMMTSLFTKLDALSSFRYTPKPAPNDIKIVSHLPAIMVEEVQPDTMADSAQLAPEEVKRAKVEVKDRSERDPTDKKRIRRQKKAHHRKVESVKKTVESRVQKINPGLGNKRAEQRSIEAIKQAVVNEGRVIKPTKESALSEKTFSSSKEFFKALQTEVKLDKKFTRTKSDIRKKRSMSKSADKLKL